MAGSPTGSSSPRRSPIGPAASTVRRSRFGTAIWAGVTYSDPEVASVGLGEQAAREAYGEIETLAYDLGGNGKSQILKTPQGFVKLIRQVAGPVVGVHLVGSRVSELISEAQLITGWEAFPEDVAGLSHAHPTQAEALGEARLRALAGKPLHAHR